MDKRKFPRSVVGAKKKGWCVVHFLHDRSRTWFGLTMSIKLSSKGHIVSLYNGADGQILFENSSDALFASLKFNGNFQ